jgi:23S rRNA G2445 N2-methylase RlmL
MKQPHKIVISCAPSTAPYLAEELGTLGYTVFEINPTDVVTEGNLQDCMRLNLHLRTAHRVLLVIAETEARTADQLYQKARNIPWEDYFSVDVRFSIDSFVRNESIRDFRFASLKLKDAIADRFQQKFKRRPDSGKEKDQAVLFMHWVEEKVSLALDTSGETIAKHGYRLLPWKAPLLESIAAAAILASRWDRQSPFVNPMCGSGTLAIEAAQMALNHPAGLYRDNFGFMHLRGYQAGFWQDLVKEAKEDKWTTLSVPIIASDINPNAIAAARQNAKAAGVEEFITFEVCEFKETTVPEEPGVVMFNPEWGLRLGDQEALAPVYKEIGNFFKARCSGYWGYIFTGNLELAKQVGLRTKRRIEFVNSKIDSRLLEYELYRGSKK